MGDCRRLVSGPPTLPKKRPFIVNGRFVYNIDMKTITIDCSGSDNPKAIEAEVTKIMSTALQHQRTRRIWQIAGLAGKAGLLLLIAYIALRLSGS